LRRRGEAPPPRPNPMEVLTRPVRQRLQIMDATIEAVVRIHDENPRGLLMVQDELAGLLGNMSRYSGGTDRPFWLTAWNGIPHFADRRSKREPVWIPRLSVGVLGGIQPARLEAMLRSPAQDDGLLARCLLVWPEPAPMTRLRTTSDPQRLRETLERLLALEPQAAQDGGAVGPLADKDDLNDNAEEDGADPVLVPLTEAAADRLHGLREDCRRWEEAEGTPPLLVSHIGKMPGLAARVALILAHLDWAADGEGPPPEVVGEAAMARACHLVGTVLRAHAERVYGAREAHESPEVAAARRVAQLIRTERLEAVAPRDLQRRNLKGLGDAAQVARALAVLVQAGWLGPALHVGTGRNPRRIHLVLPGVHEG